MENTCKAYYVCIQCFNTITFLKRFSGKYGNNEVLLFKCYKALFIDLVNDLAYVILEKVENSIKVLNVSENF